MKNWRHYRFRDLSNNSWNWGKNNGYVIDEGILWKPMQIITDEFKLARITFGGKSR